MTPAEIIAKLDDLHAAGKFHGLTIWPSKGGYQVSLATTSEVSWRIRLGATPSEGLAEVLGAGMNEDGALMPWPLNRGQGEIIEPRDFEDAALADLEREQATESAGVFD